MDKKVLLCVSPYVSLIKKSVCSEMQLGPPLVMGLLSGAGIDTVGMDLNALVDQWREETPLFSSNELAILSSSFLAYHYDQMVSFPREYGYAIPSLIDRLLAAIPQGPYACVCLSLPWTRQSAIAQIITLNFACLLARRIKAEMGCKVILGGALFSKISKEFLTECLRNFNDAYVDYVFIGEPGDRLVRLIEKLERGAGNTLYFSDITFMGCRQIFRHSSLRAFARKHALAFSRWSIFRSVVERIKKIASFRQKSYPILRPDYSLQNATAYAVDVKRCFRLDEEVVKSVDPKTSLPTVPIKIFPLQFTRGCNFGCAFCQMAGSSLHYLSPAQAVDSIERIQEREPGAKYFRFYNTHINWSAEYALAFSKEIIRRNIKIFFSDSASLRKPAGEVFQALREAGCVKLYVGVESASDVVLAKMNKRLTVSEIEKGLELIHKSGIWIGANLLTGLPFERDEDHSRNIAFIKTQRDKVNVWVVSRFKLYPMVPLCFHRKRYGLTLGRKSFPGHDYSFSETGVSTTEESHRRGQHCYEELMGLLSEYNDVVADNDYLLFYCYCILGYSKEATASLLRAYYGRIKDDRSFVETLSLCQGYDYDIVQPYYKCAAMQSDDPITVI